MGGSVEGGRKAYLTNIANQGPDWYKILGARGGKVSRGGGFTNNPELARIAGRKGGLISKRGPASDAQKRQMSEIMKARWAVRKQGGTQE